MKIPKISIGIPIYNEKDTLKQTLISVSLALKKISLKYEILLCFNGTTDNGIQVAKEMKNHEPNIKILESENGRTKAMKKIINTAKGEMIIFCDADIIVDEYCYFNILKKFQNEKIIAVVGNPIPIEKKGVLYHILNARMMNFGSEISRKPIDGFKHKPFVHGRIFIIKREFFINNYLFEERFENAINDDMFITHLIILQHGRKAITHEENAKVKYLPVQSINSWWQKWVRLWGDLDYLYIQNPEFKKLKSLMKTKIDWNLISNKPISSRFYFIAERCLHYSGRFYFNITKKVYRRKRCLRLNETKKEFQIMQ